MKSLFKIALAVAVALPVLAACTKEQGGPSGDVKVTGVTLDKTTASVAVGGTVSLVATVTPADASNKNVQWSTSNEAVATVNNGVVTGVAAGNAEVTVTTADGGFTAKCSVTVTGSGEEVPVTGVTLDKTELKLVEDDSDVLVETVLPENATNKEVLWISDNNDIATVDNGLVSAVGAGVVTVKVITVDGSFEAACTVTVTPKGSGGEFIQLRAEMISTNNEMQYVAWDFTPQGEWGATTSWINWDIHHYSEQCQAEHGMDAPSWRRARYAQPENLWDGDYDTCFHTNFDIYETGGSWAVREGAIVPDNYIQIELDEPVSKFNLYIRNPMQRADFLIGKGFVVHKNDDGTPKTVGSGVQIKVSDDGEIWKSATYVDPDSGETVQCPFDFPTCVDREAGEGFNSEYTWENLECEDVEDIYFIRIQPDSGLTSVGSIAGSHGDFGIAELQLYKVE